jgi:hypothetical protein
VAVRVSGTKVDSFGAYRTWRRYGQVTMETYRDLGVVSIEDGYIVCDVPPHSVTSFLGKVQ